jgi:hypothetical protein
LHCAGPKDIGLKFDKLVTPQAVTQHISAMYAGAEWSQDATCKKDLQVRWQSGRQVFGSAEPLQPSDHSGSRIPRLVAAQHAVPALGQHSFGRISDPGHRRDDAKLKDPDADYFKDWPARIVSRTSPLYAQAFLTAAWQIMPSRENRPIFHSTQI